MLTGAVLVLRAATKTAGRWRTQASIGAVAIAVTVAAGILTTITQSNWWSAVMATGFITSLLSYGRLLIPARTLEADLK